MKCAVLSWQDNCVIFNTQVLLVSLVYYFTLLSFPRQKKGNWGQAVCVQCLEGMTQKVAHSISHIPFRQSNHLATSICELVGRCNPLLGIHVSN